MLGHSTVLSAEPLEYGDAGTMRTIEKVRGIVNDAWRSLDVRRFAIDILRNAGAPQYNDWAKASAIYDWIKCNFYFVLDPVTKEVLMPFPDLIELGAGDCDEINATAMAVLLGVIGYEPRLVTIAANSEDPETFSHVYAEAFIQGNWIPMDAARPGAQMGVAPPSYFRRAWWSLIDDSYGDYPGTGRLDGMRRHKARLHGYAGVGLGQGYSDPTTGEWIDTSGEASAGAIGPGITDVSSPVFDQSGSAGGIDWASIFSSGIQGAATILKAVEGPSSALRPAMGPGGYSSVSPSGGILAPPSSPISSNMLLLLLGGGLLLWAVTK
jgi:Transglutaminase-like superfamily